MAWEYVIEEVGVEKEYGWASIYYALELFGCNVDLQECRYLIKQLFVSIMRFRFVSSGDM